MAIAVHFHPKGMTLDQFNESHRRLDAAGAAAASPGRLHHSCFGDDGDLMVFQVWESMEAFEAFGATLMPILAEVGIDPGEPSVMAVHRFEQTTASQTA
ncbi:MAG TPA: hypothetical protein VED63_09910 [Acidimicrobiales bacterium]|nr:hypothetical protein [Acidimicrobiales bacterium]